MLSQSESHRRRRSEYEDDEDADTRISQVSPSSNDSAKRMRISAPQRSHRQDQYDDDDDDDEGSDGGVDMSAFQPGAIVRVKLTNFITYESAEFFPGPNLNMVIGPNGTGKSSLVCAICLGLGWGPATLARAGKVGEFVKHGNREAYVEIELYRRPDEARNHIVRLKINRDGNPTDREWWLNNRKTSLTAIKDLVSSFNIQVDNLCQFLPQEKVAEFAGLTPVDLLLQTQRAAAPQEMLDQHEELKKLRKGQKGLQHQTEADREHLERLEHRQASLKAEVEKLEELEQVQERIVILNNTIPFVDYRVARQRHMECKKLKEEAQRTLRTLEANLAPTLESVHRKEQYQELIKVAAHGRKKAVELAEAEADQVFNKIAELEESIQSIGRSMDAEKDTAKKTKQEMNALGQRINALKSQLNTPAPEFNLAEFSEKLVSILAPIYALLLKASRNPKTMISGPPKPKWRKSPKMWTVSWPREEKIVLKRSANSKSSRTWIPRTAKNYLSSRSYRKRLAMPGNGSRKTRISLKRRFMDLLLFHARSRTQGILTLLNLSFARRIT